MEKNIVSRTSLIMAYCRGYHAKYDIPKIFDDFLAYQLLGEENRTYFDKLLTLPLPQVEIFDPFFAATNPNQKSILAWAMERLTPLALTVCRAQYTENNLRQAIKQGVRQYVILGAGLDTFAFRHPELADQLQVFEVDHYDTQTYKRNRLTELDWKLPKNLHLIPADFTQENLATILKTSAFDPKSLSFFSWLGGTFYLTCSEVLAMLRSIADISSPGSSVVFDYFDADVLIPGKPSPLLQKSLEDARQHGEPIQSGFDPSRFVTELASIGLRLHEDLSPHDINERFFQGRQDNYHAYELIHLASAISGHQVE